MNQVDEVPENQLHDRLIDLLVTNNLPLPPESDDGHPEMRDLGTWTRKSIARMHREQFLFTRHGIHTAETAQDFAVSHDLLASLIRLNAFFTRNTAVIKTVFEASAVEQAFRHPSTVSDMRNLIKLADSNTLSETGGIAAIDAATHRVHFLPVTSLNEVYARKLTQDRDWGRLLPILEDIRQEIPFLPVRTRRIIDTLKSETGDAEKNQAYESYLELFLFYSRYGYIGSQSQQYAEIATHGLPGYYLGLFHVHPPDNTPSPEDRMESILRKNLVIIPRAGGIEIQYLFYGGQPDAEPQIIFIRTDS